ncbi:xyloglucan galactosyltransferase KATAMARI1 homolog [Phragmites australis]|uniref:xyloglucan galactosyltransferase KATAMARI1 homolog n=1 Tax=Phragmites australis TaxID=29695 RepID=UPI002D772CF8|nr:xyloglucan galactosyltransferase KATAMARI1 homolog [Phragmites australis]
METNYPKYIHCALLILASWLLTCLFHFQFFHLFGGGPLVFLPFSLYTSFFSVPAIADDRRLTLCDGRYVHILDLPPRFHVCVDGSPSFDSRYSICPLMSNAGLGPVLSPAGNCSDGDACIVPSTGWYNTNQYALEVIAHNRMRRYECLTDDPAVATAVYVPYYPALELHPHMCGMFNATMRNGPSVEFLRWLSSRPAWAALGGRDHFMVASKTMWMFRRVEVVGGDDSGCGNSFLEQPESRNMTVLTYESNIWVRPRQDFAVPYPSYFHPSSAGEVAEWQARVRAAPRPWLFAFAGARRPNGTVAIRDRIFDACDAALPRRRCGKLDCGHGLQGSITCRSPRRLISLFASSRFCLQPPGDSFMRRSSVDAVMAGCIPVFFHEASTFKKQYRWHERDPGSDGDRDRRDNDRRYYVLIDQDDVLQGKVDIEEVLSRYSDDEVTTMREEVIKMIPRFLYKDPRLSFEGDMRDAFDIAIDEVLARMRRIKNGEDFGRKDENDGAVVANVS